MHHRTDGITHTTAFVTPVCGALAGTRNSSMGPPHEGSIRRPAPPGYESGKKPQKPMFHIDQT